MQIHGSTVTVVVCTRDPDRWTTVADEGAKVEKGQRIGRNPKTGGEVPILPRRVMVFKPSNVLKSRINDESNGRDSSD